jgi:hypothetical protein
MIDEQELRDAMNEVANEFVVSKEAVDRILSEARERTHGSSFLRVPAFLSRQSRGLVNLSAAALVLVVGAISLPLLLNEGGSARGPVVVHAASASPQKLAPLGTPSPQGSVTLSVNTGTKAITGTGYVAGAASLSPKIESQGSVDLTVKKGRVNSALTKLSNLAVADGGFVLSTQANASVQGSGKFSSGTVVLEVPQRTFAKLVTQVQRVGHATNVTTTSADVTAQYVDLQARISALDVSRQQYLSIMARATSISGILAVQSQLDVLQSQIEQDQGQLNVLNHATTYGTLTVKLAESGHRTRVVHHVSGLRKAWNDGIGGFVAGFEWVVRLAGPVLFAVLFLGGLLALGRLIWRATRRHRI